MERSFRFRTAGLIFYILLSLHLLINSSFADWLSQVMSDTKTLSALSPLIGLGILLFTSDAIGYIFSSLFVFGFNLWGGYARLYEKKLANAGYREFILDEISRPFDGPQPLIAPDKFNRSLDSLNHDQLLCFFIWHTKDVPEQLDDWIERRHTAYFTGGTVILAMVLATLISFAIFSTRFFEISTANCLVFLFTSFLAFALGSNSQRAMRDNIVILDLSVARKMNPNVEKLYARFNPDPPSSVNETAS